MKEKIIENGIEYVRDSDYYIPKQTKWLGLVQ